MQYLTEDGVVLETGDRAYNYYDMKPGMIGEDHGLDHVYDDPDHALPEPNAKRWFYFRHDDGSRELLNGERICTLSFARQRQFVGV